MGKRQKTVLPAATFKALFRELIPCSFLAAVLRRCSLRVCVGVAPRKSAPLNPCLHSHTPLTAMQEIAALILAYAVSVDYRVGAAGVGEVECCGSAF